MVVNSKNWHRFPDSVPNDGVILIGIWVHFMASFYWSSVSIPAILDLFLPLNHRRQDRLVLHRVCMQNLSIFQHTPLRPRRISFDARFVCFPRKTPQKLGRGADRRTPLPIAICCFPFSPSCPERSFHSHLIVSTSASPSNEKISRCHRPGPGPRGRKQPTESGSSPRYLKLREQKK